MGSQPLPGSDRVRRQKKLLRGLARHRRTRAQNEEARLRRGKGVQRNRAICRPSRRRIGLDGHRGHVPQAVRGPRLILVPGTVSHGVFCLGKSIGRPGPHRQSCRVFEGLEVEGLTGVFAPHQPGQDRAAGTVVARSAVADNHAAERHVAALPFGEGDISHPGQGGVGRGVDYSTGGDGEQAGLGGQHHPGDAPDGVDQQVGRSAPEKERNTRVDQLGVQATLDVERPDRDHAGPGCSGEQIARKTGR